MLKLEYKDYTLDFKFEAGTSRGVLIKHSVFFIKIFDDKNPEVYGIGEAAPLPNLSPERISDVEEAFKTLSKKIQDFNLPAHEEEVFYIVDSLVSRELPSVRMAMETALFDLLNGGKRLIFSNDYYIGNFKIPINGLIWMGDEAFMKKQIEEKLEAGYKCIKMKIGAIDFEKELALLKMLRESSKDLIIRVDANGAFDTMHVFRHLNSLDMYDIHSIEQPIMAGQMEAMQLISKRSPVPIALDEELITVTDPVQKRELLRFINPDYIILKPTLLGGFGSTLEWIKIAEDIGIGWWITSALESNISLNAIAQFVSNFPNLSYQGLGTGQLYHNNIDSPLVIENATLSYHPDLNWGSVF